MAELTYRGTELRRTDGGLYFWITDGFDDEADVRGDDWIAPERAGRVEGNRVKDRRLIELQGYVIGVGANEAAMRTAYRARVDDLHAIFDPTAAPGALVVHSPVMGLASGTKSINARYLNSVWSYGVVTLHAKVSVQLECIDSPPDWT